MLRAPTAADRDTVRAWRNQAINREVSVTDHMISEAEHRRWWDAVAEDPSRRMLVFVHDDLPCGAVNFFDIDLDARTGSWGFFLDNETLSAEGTLLSAWMAIMRQATDYAFDTLGLDRLHGEVLEDNAPVRQMNRRFGLVERTDDVREIDGRRFVPITLTREERGRRTRRRKKDA
ncbi:GNAT family N-acetyltransferase [Mumia sp. zg.B21]|uniref:GNAT family N-acetyltransferase n=1 Tax=Mumia sp. zg.B21 TaxID=2855447 RepID=UPI001C6E295D|nr:GNAT family N-acetyltransferase [Mumia sp. zg.B21]MBW9209510.1 GNAT family N-acetyltransferase [Mumia sp. zg.B21]